MTEKNLPNRAHDSCWNSTSDAVSARDHGAALPAEEGRVLILSFEIKERAMNKDSQKTILLIEENGASAQAGTAALEEAGYKVVPAGSGGDALRITSGRHSIDLILIDSDLGGPLCGIAIAKEILSRNSLPLIFLISRDCPEMIGAMNSMACYGCIQKNSGSFMLRSAIETALNLFSAFNREKEYRERFSQTATNSQAAIWEINPEGLYTFLNNTSEIVYGYRPEEMTGIMHFYDLHPEEGREEFKQQVLSTFEKKENLVRFPNKVRRKDGRVIWITTSGSPFMDRSGELKGYRGVDVDITESIEMRETLMRQQDYLRGILDSVQDAYIRSDLMENIIHMSPSTAAMFGYDSTDDMMGLSTGMLYKNREERIVILETLMEKGRINDRVIEGIRKDGSTFWGSLNLQYYYDKEGHIAGMEGSIRDISDRRNAEEHIKSLLRDKEILLREVHHRIKNNMNVMSSLLNLQAAQSNNPEATAALQDARSRMKGMSILYDRLYRSENLKEMSLSNYLEPLVQEIVKIFPVPLNLKTDIAVEDFALEVKYLSTMGIIVNELLTNALKHAFIGRPEGLISLSACEKDRHVTLTVADNGITIPETITLQDPAHFGLQLIVMLADQIDGTITMERDRGTRFMLEFDY